MKRIFVGGLAAALLVTAAAAQTLVLEPQHRTIIKRHVIKEPLAPVQIRGEVVVGATVPADVELVTVPETLYAEIPTVRPYSYFVWNNRVVFVEPSSRRVVQIID